MTPRRSAKQKASKLEAYNRYRQRNRVLGVNCNGRAVMVTDEMCAEPYYISRNELALFKDAYSKMDGVTVTILVKERQ